MSPAYNVAIPGMISPTNLPVSLTEPLTGWSPLLSPPRTDELDALDWCRDHNARVRFQSNKTVSVGVNGKTRRRKTLVEAVDAIKAALA